MILGTIIDLRKLLLGFFYSQVIWISPSYGYIDPGIGSMIFQGLLAGLITVSVFWRGIKNKLSIYFKKKVNSDNSADEDNDCEGTK